MKMERIICENGEAEVTQQEKTMPKKDGGEEKDRRRGG